MIASQHWTKSEHILHRCLTIMQFVLTQGGAVLPVLLLSLVELDNEQLYHRIVLVVWLLDLVMVGNAWLCLIVVPLISFFQDQDRQSNLRHTVFFCLLDLIIIVIIITRTKSHITKYMYKRNKLTTGQGIYYVAGTLWSGE